MNAPKLNLVDRIERPVFLAHGLDDPVVPVTAVQRLIEKLGSRGTMLVTRLVDDGHPPRRPENVAALLLAELTIYEAACRNERGSHIW